MPVKTIRSWLGLNRAPAPEAAPLGELVAALDQLEPARARHLARFAYLLGRVAHADRQVSDDERRTMAGLVQEHGALTPDQAMLVVSLARNSNVLFGGTADFIVAQEFSEMASYEEKLALARCLFAVGAADEAISMAEETEIHRITNHLRILPADLTRLRLEHRRFLPGLSGKPPVG
jgi:uncharacterized tellurite resistance protein B-like protein